MEKTGGSIEHIDKNGNHVEEFLFAYSEEERLENNKNKENAALVFNINNINIPIAFLKAGINGNDAIILSFIYAYLGDSQDKSLYFTDEQMAKMFNLSVSTISDIIKKLDKDNLIDKCVTRINSFKQVRKVSIGTKTTEIMSAYYSTEQGVVVVRKRTRPPRTLQSNVPYPVKQGTVPCKAMTNGNTGIRINTSINTLSNKYIYPENSPASGEALLGHTPDNSFNSTAKEEGRLFDVAPPELRKKEKSSAKKERKVVERMTEADFEAFYKAYPRHVGKPEAQKALNKIDRRYLPQIMSAVEMWKQTEWKENIAAGTKQYIRYASTWLNKGAWKEDEIDDPNNPITPLERCLEIVRKNTQDITTDDIVFFVDNAGWPAISDKLKSDDTTKQRLYKVVIDKGLDPLFIGEYFKQCRDEIKKQLDPIKAAEYRAGAIKYLATHNLTPDTMPQELRQNYETIMKNLNAPPETWYT